MMSQLQPGGYVTAKVGFSDAFELRIHKSALRLGRGELEFSRESDAPIGEKWIQNFDWKSVSGVPWWCSGIKIWNCHCWGTV